MNVDHTEPSPEFSLTEGGPGAAFMKRLRLVHPVLGAQSARIALILGGLTWLPLFVLCVHQPRLELAVLLGDFVRGLFFVFYEPNAL